MSADAVSRVDELERADRLEDAAALAEESELHARACELWERACRFDRAAASALAAGDSLRALALAARASDPELEARAIAELVASGASAHAAEQVAALGHPLQAGRLRLALGDAARAALDFEKAGALLDAARAFDGAGDPKQAARCFEAALARDAADHAARLALGELLCRHGRLEPATRVLQKIPSTAPERRRALALLAPALDSLGLPDAAREALRELTELGGAPDPEPAPALAQESAAERILFGRYRVVAEVATTPTARVVEAFDRITNERVAVKIFAPTLRESGRDALERFEREARVLGQLRHPAILPLRAYLPEGPAVVLPWMDGGSFADLLARSAISPARAVEIVIAVLAALGEAHRRGILHRDIKPANVLFDGAGAAFLADFGTAHVADSAATVTAGVLGTLAYMAPEQRAGHPANVSSDVYGAGALLWHALTGGPPEAKLDPLSSELEPGHVAIATRLVGSEAERPRDTVEARALLASLTWPKAVPEARAFVAAPVSERQLSLRLTACGGALYRDTLLEREVIVLPATPETLARVLPFARASHPALASVLAHRPEEASVWIESVAGEPCNALDAADRQTLSEALEALHRAGGAHGAVDREHLVRRGGCLVLCFPLAPRSADPKADLDALAALPG